MSAMVRGLIFAFGIGEVLTGGMVCRVAAGLQWTRQPMIVCDAKPDTSKRVERLWTLELRYCSLPPCIIVFLNLLTKVERDG